MVTTNCSYCGAELLKYPSQIKTRNYCNLSCRDKDITRPEDRFWKYVRKEGSCWEWTGAKYKGYGRFKHTSDAHGKSCFAHRFSYQLHYGDIPDGMFICHHCDNPACVNPDHLFAGTPKDNVDDMVAKGRANKPGAHGERNRGAKLTQSQVDDIRARYSFRKVTHQMLAEEYNVDRLTILRIINGQNWRT